MEKITFPLLDVFMEYKTGLVFYHNTVPFELQDEQHGFNKTNLVLLSGFGHWTISGLKFNGNFADFYKDI